MKWLTKLFAPVDMTVGRPWEDILVFHIPMLIGKIAQQLPRGYCDADVYFHLYDDCTSCTTCIWYGAFDKKCAIRSGKKRNVFLCRCCFSGS